MKGLIKFSSVALAMLAMTSCSDDLGFVDSKGKITDTSKLIGVLEQKGTTRTGMVDDRDNNYPVVWSKKDRVNVYSLTEALTYAIYELESGDGTNKAVFAEPPVYKDGIHDILGTSDKLYAVTSSPWVYGVSATMKDDQGHDLEDQKALLTVEIPTRFKWSEEDGQDQFDGYKYYYNDAPYWGHVEGTTEGQMNVQFNKLVGAIKIDAALLPEGTKAIVIATKATMPLSGTFHSVLDIEEPANSKLVPDYRLVNYNQIRADFTAFTHSTSKDYEANKRIFIMPLICGTYETLDVIAIINDKEDGTAFYGNNATDIADEKNYIPADGDRTYRGKEYSTITEEGDWVRIRTFKNVEVTTDKVLAAYPAVEQDLDNLTPMQISERIALAYDGKHDFIFNISNIKLDDSYYVAGNGSVVDAYTLDNDNTIYIPKNDPKEGAYRTASITLNFDETVRCEDRSQYHGKLFIKEANYNGRTWKASSVEVYAGQIVDTRGGLIGSVEGTASNKVNGSTVYNEAAYTTEPAADVATYETRSAASKRRIFINLTGQTSPSKTLDWDIYLPTSKLTLSNLDENMKQYGEQPSNSPNEYGVIRVIADNSNLIDNEKGTAGVNVVGNFYRVDVLAAHDGGTIVKGTDAKNGTENVTVQKLNIQNPAAALVKIDDASVADVTYEKQTGENPYLYTVGSAAIKKIDEKNGDKLRVRAFWTGKHLLDVQINDEYDQHMIYTAAQLSSMGKKVNNANSTYNGKNKPDYNYEISTKLAYMHLGGSEYPWEGAKIDAGGYWFTLEGNGAGLRYMKLNNATEVTSHGLIDEIKSTGGKVTINNINLLQAKIEKSADNVGSVVGLVETTGDLVFGGAQNSVDQIDFVTGSNVGGIFGKVNAKSATFDATKLIVKNANIAGVKNVGGLVGEVTTNGGDVLLAQGKTVEITANNIAATGDENTPGDNVGGVFGKVTAKENYRTWSKLTLTANNITADGINAGGLAGYYNAGSLASFAGQPQGGINVTASTISAGGFLTETSDKIGGNVGGLVGNADAGDFKVATGSAVNVNVKEMTSICHVGGLVGLCNAPAYLSGAANKKVTVDVKKFNNTVTDKEAYRSTEQKLAVGTFGGFVGRATARLEIAAKENNEVVNADELLSVAARLALHFDWREAEEKNVNGQKNLYWGDNSNYVGWVAEGQQYWLEGNRQMEGTDHNVYVLPAVYGK